MQRIYAITIYFKERSRKLAKPRQEVEAEIKNREFNIVLEENDEAFGEEKK